MVYKTPTVLPSVSTNTSGGVCTCYFVHSGIYRLIQRVSDTRPTVVKRAILQNTEDLNSDLSVKLE